MREWYTRLNLRIGPLPNGSHGSHQLPLLEASQASKTMAIVNVATTDRSILRFFYKVVHGAPFWLAGLSLCIFQDIFG